MFMTVQEPGDKYDKPYTKQAQAMNLIRTAAYGTAAVLAFQDLDEFTVLPSGKPIQQLLAPGGCLDGIWRYSQAAIRAKVAVATDWVNPDPNSKGKLPAWLEHDMWVDALEALNYSMAPQGP
jgi:hypothetical protein